MQEKVCLACACGDADYIKGFAKCNREEEEEEEEGDKAQQMRTKQGPDLRDLRRPLEGDLWLN